MIGQHIHNYQITARLGEGGMGIVYRATDTVLGRDVALKMLHAQLTNQSQFLERFRKEARVLAQLLHPNIAVIYNFIGFENNHFMVMEYVEGKNLDEVLRQHGVLNYQLVVPVFLQALEGLHHAHKKNIFHRDIKPSNFILTPEGTVKLMDFGIAKIAGEQRLTQVNRVVGTIEFMAPELIEGKDPSIASDIYAAGITMYELLTGKLPFEGNTDFNLMQDILKKKPLSVDKLNAAVPKELSAIVMKAIEKKPENRFTDARAFQQALIRAFPQLREADITKLQTPTPTLKPTQVVHQFSTNPGTMKATVLVDQANTNPAITLPQQWQQLKEKLTNRKNRRLLIAIACLLVLTIAGFTLFSGPDKPNLEPDNKALLAAAEKRKQDSLAQEQNKQTKTESSGGVYIPERPKYDPNPPANGDANPPRNNKEGNKPLEPVKKPVKETEKETKKPVDDRKKEEGNRNTEPKKPVEQEDKNKKEEKAPDPDPVVNITEKREENRKKGPEVPSNKSVVLYGRIEVKLYLRDEINPETARSGQALTFTVSAPVVYRGDLIIEKGAIATGRIKSLSNKKMSIVISQVVAANGQRVALEEIELSGRISEILSSRNYAAALKKGTTINF